MMPLKFRAWDNEKKVWLLGYEYPNLGGFSLFGETVLFGEWGAVVNEFLFHRDNPEDLVVDLFTGRKDKNGKDIYANDIVVRYAKNDRGILYRKNNTVRLVEWRSTFNETGFNIGNSSCLEVIGNIHENPGLLE